jgi:hypothetical protein
MQHQLCHNPNIGFSTKCEMQGPMRPIMCLSAKHTFTNGGECNGWNPMTPKCIPTLGITLVCELQMFIALVGKAKIYQIGPQDNIRKVFICMYLKWFCIVHLDLICMSYDQGVGIKLGIWIPTTNPLKAKVKWGPIEACYTCLERYFWGYKLLPLHSQYILDFKKYECPNFLDKKSPNFGILTWES